MLHLPHIVLCSLHNCSRIIHTNSARSVQSPGRKKYAVFRPEKRDFSAYSTGTIQLGVGQLAPLDAGQRVIQLLGQLADVAAADVGNLALPIQLLDRGDNGSRAGAKDFLQLASSAPS